MSRTFTPGASVAPATRERILRAAGDLGYRPNLLARSLSRQRSSTIGIAVTRLNNPFNAMLLQQLALALNDAGYGVRLFVSQGDDDADPGLKEIVRHRVDALIVCAIDLSSTLAHECAALGVPVVMVNRRTAEATAACVVGDNHAGGACVGRFLVACGHRRLAFVGGTPNSSTSRDRQAGYVEAVREKGLAGPAIAEGLWEAPAAAMAARALLGASEPPDAIFCANDHMAIAVVAVARQEYGRAIGRDLSVVGFDDIAAAVYGTRLTSYAQPVAALANRTVDTVLALIDGTAIAGTSIVTGRLIVRGFSRVPDGCRLEADGTRWWPGGASTDEYG